MNSNLCPQQTAHTQVYTYAHVSVYTTVHTHMYIDNIYTINKRPLRLLFLIH